MTYGGSAEIGFDIWRTSQYFRARGAAVADRISNETSGSAVFEWIPIVDGLLNSPLPLPAGLPMTVVFAPNLQVRYDNVIVNDATGAKDHKTRIGPDVGLRYKFIDTVPQEFAFLRRLHGQTSYSWLSSAGTDLTYSYFNTSLTYNINPEGHIGLTGSYTKGRVEDTGRKVDLWKAGLTAKW